MEKRSDGYHNIESVFYPINICDSVEIVESASLRFGSSGISIPGAEEDNLCLKAYKLIKQDFDIPPVSIHLHKHIPIGAGLGGGSADAAFLIRLINEKFALQVSTEAMQNYARKIGSDCAFFIANKPVLAYNKGDEFTGLLLDLSGYVIVLVMPPVHVSTKDAYSGVRPRKPLVPLRESINLPIEEWKGIIHNDFEDSIFPLYPQIKALKEDLYHAGALYASMSGSGAAVYGIFRQKPELPVLGEGYQVFYIPPDYHMITI